MSEETIKQVAGALAAKTMWMRLVAVLLAVNALIMAITIVGLLVAWLPGWMAYLLWKSADSVQVAAGSGDGAALQLALGQLGTYFTIMGVLILIGLVFGAIAFGLGLTAAIMQF